MHTFGITADQWVPVVKVLALGNQPVSARAWKPGDGSHILRRQQHAIRHQFIALGIIAACTFSGIKQPTADAGPVDFASVFIFKLGQAAFATAIAKRFPLGPAHLFERLGFPERLPHHSAIAGAALAVKACMNGK